MEITFEERTEPLFKIRTDKYHNKGSTEFYQHAFGNCQSLFFRFGYDFGKITDKNDMKLFLFELYEKTNKTQMVLDLNESNLDSVKSALNPFKKKFQSMKYTSTNNSKMVLCIVQLDPTKLK